MDLYGDLKIMKQSRMPILRTTRLPQTPTVVIPQAPCPNCSKTTKNGGKRRLK